MDDSYKQFCHEMEIIQSRGEKLEENKPYALHFATSGIPTEIVNMACTTLLTGVAPEISSIYINKQSCIFLFKYPTITDREIILTRYTCELTKILLSTTDDPRIEGKVIQFVSIYECVCYISWIITAYYRERLLEMSNDEITEKDLCYKPNIEMSNTLNSLGIDLTTIPPSEKYGVLMRLGKGNEIDYRCGEIDLKDQKRYISFIFSHTTKV